MFEFISLQTRISRSGKKITSTARQLIISKTIQYNLNNKKNQKMTCCPFGPIMAFPIFFGLVALGLTLTSTFSCHLIDTKSNDIFNATRGFGPWTVQGQSAIIIADEDIHAGNITWKGFENSVVSNIDNFLSSHDIVDSSNDHKCFTWSQIQASSYISLFDEKLTMARAFSMAAALFGVMVSVKLLMFACCRFRSFHWTGFLCMVEALLTGLTLLMTQSSYCKDADMCKLGYSGITCIVATVMWVLMSMFLCYVPSILRDDDILPK
jgi:hypothetical protein